MVFDEKTELEYMMLRNYQENGLVGRRVLIQIPFVALEKIEEDKWYTKVDENEKPKVRGIIWLFCLNHSSHKGTFTTFSIL
jgi:hypothetical protein